MCLSHHLRCGVVMGVLCVKTLFAAPIFERSMPLSANAHYHQLSIEGVSYGVVEALPESVSLHWKDASNRPYSRLGTLKKALEQQNLKPIMLMNAGIFSDTYRPAGLWVEQGVVQVGLNRAKGKGNFHIQPNGVFLIKQQAKKISAEIVPTERYVKAQKGVVYAVQSGPMLVIDGKINGRFIKNLSSPYKRNAVCVTKQGKLYFVMTLDYQQEWPSFYALASALTKMGCEQALYLDGSISAWYVANGFRGFHWTRLVGMIAVSEKVEKN